MQSDLQDLREGYLISYKCECCGLSMRAVVLFSTFAIGLHQKEPERVQSLLPYNSAVLLTFEEEDDYGDSSSVLMFNPLKTYTFKMVFPPFKATVENKEKYVLSSDLFYLASIMGLRTLKGIKSLDDENKMKYYLLFLRRCLHFTEREEKMPSPSSLMPMVYVYCLKTRETMKKMEVRWKTLRPERPDLVKQEYSALLRNLENNLVKMIAPIDHRFSSYSLNGC